MPHLPARLVNTVFFLYELNPKSGRIEGPEGTGSIISRPHATNANLDHYYAVSNWHLVNTGGASIIRINTLDGTTRPIEKQPDDWHFIPNSDDLSACDITDDLNIETDDVSCIPESGFATDEFLRGRFRVGVGDNLIMLGLFADQEGGQKNIPSGRFGNISMMADISMPIMLDNGTKQPCHIGDMRSRAGYSGSPVFVYRTPADDLSLIHTGIWNIDPGTQLFMKLLGVHFGQYWDPIRFRKALREKEGSKDQATESVGDPIVEGDEHEAEGALTLIAPASRINALLNIDPFPSIRSEREARLRDKWPKLPRAELTRG